MKKRKISVTAQSVFIICAMLLSVDLVMGFLFLSRSKKVIRTLMNERMLDIVNTSADLIDGDTLENITEESVGESGYNEIYHTLEKFQENINLEYIYTVRDMQDGTFVFTVDPEKDKPAPYGYPVTVTEALKKAAKGTPTVDQESYSDIWGRFYSAYSPVFNQKGQVAGIVCVDFSADWYEKQLHRYAVIILIFSVISLVVGVIVVWVITARLRSRLREMNGELEELTTDMDELVKEIDTVSDGEQTEEVALKEHEASSDDMNELSGKIRAIRKTLREHIDNMQTQANGMITAMASDYRSVYYVNLDQDEGICYRAHGGMDSGIKEGENFSYFKTFSNYACQYVAEHDREEFLKIITPENIRRELEKESIVAHRYMVVRNGQESYEMIRMAGIRHPEDREDHIVHAVGVGFTDVDRETRETLEQQQALSDALALAEEANKAKTAFLSSMSHEIRTPMNAIIGLDNIALNDPELSEHTKEYLEKIGGSAKHLLGLINDILDMSRIESGRMTIKNEEFSMAKFLEQINTMVDSQCNEKGLIYDCQIDSDLEAYYIGDAMKLKQVIINILGNAVKFTPEGGTVRFGVRKTAAFEGKTTLRFTMSDTGIGMDKAYLPKLFDAFSQEDSSANNKYGSTGLGMAITKNIVEMMNGEIQVDSEKGRGTTFTVTVTLMDSERKTKGGNDEVLLHGLSVLVVDDDKIACEHAHLVLEKLGISSESASSGEEAIEMVRLRHARQEPYDLILMDYKMPEMDGVETTQKIRELFGDDPAIITLTAYNWDEIQDDAKKAGVNGFLAKPLIAANVQEELQKVLRKELKSVKKEKAQLEGRHILLAEDMMINAEIMKEILKMRDMEADHAVNGKEAVEAFASHEEGFYDAILMDMRMPEMDGLEATAAIRAMERADAKTIPIIALTANAFDEDVQRSLQAGLNAHLSKPVEPDSLFATLENLIS